MIKEIGFLPFLMIKIPDILLFLLILLFSIEKSS